MSRGKGREERIEESLAELGRQIATPSDHELRAMARSAAAARREPPGPRGRPRLGSHWIGAAVAVALLLGSSLGFGLGVSVTPSGGAAEVQGGLGFLPEKGWNVVRSRTEASPEWPSFAIAANVPLERDDAAVAGRRDFSGHPSSTLYSLARHGIVIVASFALRGVHEPSDDAFPVTKLPLRLRDASVRPSSYARPSGPHSVYELRAGVNHHNVIVNVYFGMSPPSRSSIIAAQHQLDRLVVGNPVATSDVGERAIPLRPSENGNASRQVIASRVIDRTFVCSPIAYGGVGDLDLYVTPARDLGTFGKYPAYLRVSTGGSNPNDNLVFVRARLHGGTATWLSGAVRGSAGVYAHYRRCAPAGRSAALSSQGLPGPPIRWYKELDCSVRGRVIVRVRALLRSRAEWGRVDRSYAGARAAVVEAKIAVRAEATGKPIAYMELDRVGTTRLWYSSICS